MISCTPLNSLQLGSGWFPEQRGGLERFYHDLLHHLPEVGVRCRGLVTGTAAGWPADLAVSVRAFAPARAPMAKRWLAERRAVAEELAEQQFDLAVSHFAPYAYPVLSQVSASRPLVVHFQGPWAQESREEGGGRLACALKAAIERRVYQRAARLIVLSSAFRQILVDHYQIAADAIHVIPGGVDCDRFDIAPSRDECRSTLGWPTDRPIVLAVRRLARRMGLENLIESADALRVALPGVLILIAGGGALRAKLDQLIRERNLGRTVRLLGFVPDAELPLAYRAADLTVVPTVALEGFGLVAAESLAAGTPALATPVGGLIDVVGPLSKALLFGGSGAADLAAGITAAIKNRSALPDAAQCAAYARRRFGWDVIAGQISQVYREAVSIT